MSRKTKRQYVDDDEIIVYDSTDDEFDDELNGAEASDTDPEQYKNFEKHEMWDEVDGEWFETWLPKGSVVPTDEQIQRESNAWPVTLGVVIGVAAIIALAIGVSCWLYL